MRRPAIVVVTLALISAASTCGRTDLVRFDLPAPVIDAGRDAGLDTSIVDAGPDAGLDAGLDGGEDAGEDAGTDAGFDAGVKPCLEGRFTLSPATPVVVLVLDRSGSMQAPFAGGLTKWTALRDALTATLPSVDQTMQLGLLLYPVSLMESCSSFTRPAPEPALGQVATVLQELDAATPAGGTPTADALEAAVSSLLGRRTGSTARAIVLATDGEPNCNPRLDPRACLCRRLPCGAEECVDEERTVGRIANALDAGIPTYVIGIEGTGDLFGTTLDAMAVAGGRAIGAPGQPRYYAVNSAAELAQAFASIRDQVARCTFLTSSVPNATGSIRVEADGQVVAFDPAGREGWSWTDPSNGELVFRGLACTRVMTGSQRLEAIVACGQ